MALVFISQIKNPLDPLLDRLASDFTDNVDLSRRLKNYYHVRIRR